MLIDPTPSSIQCSLIQLPHRYNAHRYNPLIDTMLIDTIPSSIQCSSIQSPHRYNAHRYNPLIDTMLIDTIPSPLHFLHCFLSASSLHFRRRAGRVSLSRSASGRSMNINPRGVLRPVRNEPGYGLHTDQEEEDSPSGHGLRGLSVLLEHVPQVRRQVPEERHREGLHDDMKVGAEARSCPRILRRGSWGRAQDTRRRDHGERGEGPPP